jgi:hypothetical protein
MTKNLKKYYQAWELRQQGKKLREIAQIMGFKTIERPRQLITYIDCRIKKKFKPISQELSKLIQKYKVRV